MIADRASSIRIPPRLTMNWVRNTAIQLDFFAEIRDNVANTGAAVLKHQPPPDHNGGTGSTMISTYDTPATDGSQARKNCSQDWPAYNAAQTHEQEHFVDLLRRLCADVPQPEQHMGRKRLPLADTVFSATYKVYSTMSGRRFMPDMRESKAQGLASVAPSYSSTARVLENPDLTPILKELIERSALPLKSIETDFAVDSTGFSTSVYGRWYDHRYGKERTRQVFVKTHLMTGVKTNIVTSVEATITESADAPQLPALVAKTAENFTLNEVSADKAYSSRRNLHAIDMAGAKPFIPFKQNTNGVGKSFDSLWSYMWAYYQYNRTDFMAHYHKRSNAESTMWMIKSKMGGSVRSKTPVAQVNEVLCKVLAHNICCLISSIYELGIEPTFATKMADVADVG